MWKIVTAGHSKLSNDDKIEVVSKVNSLDYLYAEILEYSPSAVVIAYDLIKEEEEQFYRSISEIYPQGNMVVIMNSQMENDDTIDRWCKNAYPLIDPDERSIKSALNVLLAEFKKRDVSLGPHISRMLGSIGISAHLDGYKYIRDAIEININFRGKMKLGDIYRSLAKKYNKNVPCIERSIRNAIERAWMSGDIEYINFLFGFTVKPESGKPSNREFIAMLTDRYYNTNAI